MATGDPRGLLVVQAVLTRLQRIKTADGYFTDAGETAEIGPVERANLSVSVAVQFASETPQPDKQGNNTGNPQVANSYLMQRSFTIVGQIKTKPDETKGIELEYLLADIKRAVFDGKAFDATQRLTLGWPTYTGASLAPRELGNEFESVSVTGTTTYTEAIGDPSNA